MEEQHPCNLCPVFTSLHIFLEFIQIRLKHGIGADQDFFMLYDWYRKNKHDINKFYKLSRLTVTYLTLLKISRC